MTRWSVGDLAKASGLTVRTLHHHDEIGLVVASERTPSGHRRYTPDDVRRLYQVRSLRQLGLSLEEVRVALSSSDSLRPSPSVHFGTHVRVRELVELSRQWDENKGAISSQIGWPADDGLVDHVGAARRTTTPVQ